MLHGTAVSEGIGLGRVMVLKEYALVHGTHRKVDAAAEKTRLLQAVQQFCENTAQQVEMLKNTAGKEDAGILECQIEMAQDPALREEVGALIDSGRSAESALKEICDRYIGFFANSHDELTRLRGEDLRDMRQSLLCLLLGVEGTSPSQAPRGTVLVAHELTPSMMSGVDRDRIVAIVTEAGGRVSHASILARAMGVPTVCGVSGAIGRLREGSFIIVDGTRGDIIITPDQEMIEAYWLKRAEFIDEAKKMEHFRHRKTVSASGQNYQIFCNISMPSGSAGALNSGGEGVGLFRSEYLFMNRRQPPDEEEQTAAYIQTAQGAQGRPTVIRTIDVGGDKEIPSLPQEQEENPFLGLRGIRWCLKHQEIFMTQLRALLRAGVAENTDIRVMFPMVSTIEELREGRELLRKARAQLESQGIPCAPYLPVGAMVETPAAVFLADSLAVESDFLSVGTNDLTGYVMACDRGNSTVSEMYAVFQPAVLRALRFIASCGVKRGVPVSICGEAASDPRLIPLLMSFGIHSFSVSPGAVLGVRSVVSSWANPRADKLAREVLGMQTLNEVMEALERACQKS